MAAYTQPYIRPTSFAEVENIYNNTKPMRGKNKGKDGDWGKDKSTRHDRPKGNGKLKSYAVAKVAACEKVC